MRVVAISLITNKGAGISPTPLTHDEVLEAANVAGPRLARVIRGFVRDLPA
jgi:purine-nucleoside phosphorylase